MQKLGFVKCHANVKMPVQQHKGDAGFDVHMWQNLKSSAGDNPTSVTLYAGDCAIIDTGLIPCIPKGYVLKLYARSGLAIKHGIVLTNQVGIIDQSYQGNLMVCLTRLSNCGEEGFTLSRGDRIAQFCLEVSTADDVELVEVTSAGFVSSRGVGGVGSTGVRE